MENKLPAVSVIIPMYNVEKYISETLNSIFGQTLKDFEIIVVNDCSTDNSAKVVESFIPKFGGRLKLIHTKTNRGCAGIPRNKGLEFSRGKYIYFMDSDDVISTGTLELFYQTAEKYHCDAVLGQKYFMSTGVGKNFLKQAVLIGDVKDTTTKMVTEDLALRVKTWSENVFEVSPGLKFLRRDFLVENEIKFLPIMQEDSLWTFEIICLAKNIIVLPHAFYIVRRYENSLSTRALNTNFDFGGIFNKVDRIINGLKHVDEFMGGLEFFQKNPAYRQAVITHIVMQNVGWLTRVYGNVPQFQFYEKLKEVLAKDTGDCDVLISCLISSWIKAAKISTGKK